ncbi:hypothetical protein H1R20_g473, partial [Candolleomyces eurysporus]
MRVLRPVALTLALAATTANAGLVDDIVNAIKNAATCATCQGLFVPLKVLAALGDGPFTKTFVAVCKVISPGMIDRDVCEGAVKTQAPILAHDLRSISPFGQTAEKLCDALVGLCQPPAVNAYKVPFPKPAPANPKTFVSSGKTPFQVVHFSDIHIDRQYTVGAEASCTKPICCRNYADQTGPVTNAARPYGSRNCDTPTFLAQNFLRTIGSNNKFSIFTGDVIEASVWLADRVTVQHDIEEFNRELTTIPQVPVYPALGNHESAPTNAFPRNTTTKKGASSQWVFDTVSKGWEPVIGKAAADQAARLSGSYSAIVPGTNLKILSINTVYWYKSNFWLYDSNKAFPDPNGIIGFAAQELQAAEDAGQRVWIIAHMPTNRKDALRDQTNYFDQVVQRYKHVIAGQFFGHSHQDQFAVGYSDYSRQSADTATSMAWVVPAITPRSSNPRFKVYDVDPDTYEIMDSKVYHSDVNDPSFDHEPKWELVYSARELYGPLVPGHPATASLNPAFWHRVTEAFERNQTAFELYQSLRLEGGKPMECDATCKKDTICQLRALRSESACDYSTPGLNFRREEGQNLTIHEAHTDECEGIGLSHVLKGVAEHRAEIDWDQLQAELEAIVADAEANPEPVED